MSILGGTQNYQFGAGDVVLKAINTFATPFPTPVHMGTLQDVSVEFSGSTKPLYGKLRHPVAVAGTESTIKGKAKFALFNAAFFNLAYFGQATQNVGEANRMIQGESATPVAGTFTVANGATFVTDLGIFDTVTGLWNVRIASGTPSAGQYKFTTGGVYTVNSSDTNPKLVWYTYSTTTATQLNFKIPNIPMGQTPQFALYLGNGQWNGIEMTLALYQCISNKLGMGWKNNDWMVPDFEFEAYDDGTGNLGEFNYDQAA